MSTVLTDPIAHENRGGAPGWSVVVDLTPPEVLERRRTHALRRVVVLALALVVVLCGAGFAFSVLHAATVQDSLASTQAETERLMAEQRQFDQILASQAQSRAIESQLSTLLATDVDAAGMLTRLRQLLPGSMSLTSISIAMTPAGATTGADPAVAAAGTTSAQDALVVGTVTLSGKSQELADLAAYVGNLEAMDGVVGVIPATNTAADDGTSSWTVTLQLTDAIYTHRYDLKAPEEAS